MNDVFAVLLLACCSITSGVLTGRFRAYALRRGLMDVPNERSSHKAPTPRGGGVAIVIAVLLALPLLALLHRLAWATAGGMVAAGAVAAAVGYADDRNLIALLPRLGAHFAAALLVGLYIGFGSIAAVLQLPASATWVAVIVGVLYAVWMLNLTNFMDGIDGLAGIEVVTVCVSGALCAWIRLGSPHDSSFGAFAVAAATAGFLVWNWPPAKIFMGDAGSGFLGISLAALSLVAGNESPNLFWSWLIVSGVFVVDATITLAVRIGRREAFYMAHRSHAYQHAAGRWNHRRVTVAVALINILWLLPWAVYAAMGPVDVVIGVRSVAAAYLPLFVLALVFRAGRSE